MKQVEYSNYLKDKKDYIVTGIYNINDFKLDWRFFKRKDTFVDKSDFNNSLKWRWYIKELLHKWIFVDYYTEEKNTKFFTIWSWFVISQITDKPLYSTEYKDCTGIVAIGKDKETWKNVWFLTHQRPDRVVSNKKNSKENFVSSLNKIITELKNKCKNWTIDITLLWWRNDDNFKNYKKILNLTNKIVEKKLWFSLQVTAWPSISNPEINTSKNILVDTETRRILLFKEYNSPTENVDFHIRQTEQVLQKLLEINEEYIQEQIEIILNNWEINNYFIKQIKDILDSLDSKIFDIFDKDKIKKTLIPVLLKKISGSSETEIIILKEKWYTLKIEIKSVLWILRVRTNLSKD